MYLLNIIYFLYHYRIIADFQKYNYSYAGMVEVSGTLCRMIDMALSDYIEKKPVIETKRLIIRPMRADDVDALRKWLPDRSIYTYWGKVHESIIIFKNQLIISEIQLQNIAVFTFKYYFAVLTSVTQVVSCVLVELNIDEVQ